MSLQPIVKWAGGKRQLLETLRGWYPAGLGTRFRRYAEPFVGGGAVLFDLLPRYEWESVYISDINAELIATYLRVREDPEGLIDALADLQGHYLEAPDPERRTLYLEKRARFNALKAASARDTELASLFIFLNRTCFNGLYRVNRRGEFNVPIGSYKHPLICDAENIRAVSVALQGVTIVHADYEASESFINDCTFAYFDPPYRPLSQTSSFTSYSSDDFNDEEQSRLSDYLQMLSNRGATLMESNSDPKNSNPDDNFFDDLYHDFIIERVSASRVINSKADNRGKISELLIMNYSLEDKIKENNDAEF